MYKAFGMTFLLIEFFFVPFAQFKKYVFTQPKMGSPFNIVIYSLDSANAAKASVKIFSLIDTLNEIYSDYLPNSELNRLCTKAGTGKWMKVSEPLFSILQKSYRASEVSSGSFDITVSPVVRLWRTARRLKRIPDRDSLQAAMKVVGYKYIEIDSAHKKIRLQKRGMQLDLGGIGQGEMAQRAYNRLKELGFPYSLIDVSGDVVAGSVPPEINGWKIAVNLPESEELMNQQLLLKNKSVTTSGDVYQYLELNGVRYSHIIDPATGWALTNSRNVTVISTNGTDADWLTKACTILPIDKALQLVAKFPSTEVQIAVLKDNKPFYYRSPGFMRNFMKPNEK